MVRRFLARGCSLDKLLPKHRVILSPSPSFMSSPSSSSSSSSSRGSISSGRGSMDEEEVAEVVAAAAPLRSLQKRVLSMSHGSRDTPGRHFDLPPKTARDGGMPSGDHKVHHS